MKNIFKIFGLAAIMSVVFTSCGEEPYDIEDGGKLQESISPPASESFIFNVTTAVAFELNPTSNGVGIGSIVATKVLETSLGDSDPVNIDVTSGSFSQDIAGLFADVPVAGGVLTQNDLRPGDRWVITYTLTTSAGDVLDIPYTTRINFACPSEIPTDDDGATWTGETQEGAFGVFSSNDNITISAGAGAGDYNVDDLTGGFYEAFGFNTYQGCSINELCGTVVITGNADAQFDIQTVGQTGTWDPATGVLTVPWYDVGNDFGDVTVFTQN